MRRMQKITGRSDDMMIIRGVNVFPSQIEELILRLPALTAHYYCEITRPKTLDELRVFVERQPDADDAAGAGHQLEHTIKSLIGVSAAVEVLPPGGVERSLGKAKRIVDRRSR